jgi:hypothetical protein
MDFRHVYILQKTGKRKVSIVTFRKMLNASKVEKNLHNWFSDSKTDPKRVRFSINGVYKVGISNNVTRRLEEINESNLESGATEWFSLNWLEVTLLIILLNWYAFNHYIYLTLFIIFAIWILLKIG